MEKRRKDKIHIVFSKTNTRMGYFIRRVTKYPYNHVSLYLEETNTFYSFSRIRYDLPMVGGLVNEDIFRLMYPKNKLDVEVVEIPVSAMQLQRIKNHIGQIQADRDRYMYNMLSLFRFRKRPLFRVRHAYNCVEFVSEILRNADVLPREATSRMIFPQQLFAALHEYEAIRTTVVHPCVTVEVKDQAYLKKENIVLDFFTTMYYFYRLSQRTSLFDVETEQTAVQLSR